MIRQLDDILNQRDYQAVNYVMQSLQRKSLRLEHATPQVDFCSPLSTSACVLVSLSLSLNLEIATILSAAIVSQATEHELMPQEIVAVVVVIIIVAIVGGEYL